MFWVPEPNDGSFQLFSAPLQALCDIIICLVLLRGHSTIASGQCDDNRCVNELRTSVGLGRTVMQLEGVENNNNVSTDNAIQRQP